MTFEEMWSDYIQDVHKMSLHATDKYFFTYTSSDEDFWIVDVYVAPEYRRTKVVKELYDYMDEFAAKSGKKYVRSMVQRKDPHFDAALALNLKYGMKPIEERPDGKIFLRKELR